MIRQSLPFLLLCFATFDVSHADLITNLEFGDPIWSTTVTVFGSRSPSDAGSTGPIFDGGSSPNGQAVLVEDTFTSGGGGVPFGGVHLLIDLAGSISTVGFQNVTLQFEALIVNNMEFVGATPPSQPSPNGDGILIESAAGLNFDGVTSTGITPAFRSALQTPQVWSSANASTFSQDLSFDSSVDNSSIDNLSFEWQIDANDERWVLLNFSLQGDPFVATATMPEPSACWLIGLGCAGWAIRRRMAGRSASSKPADERQLH